MGEITPLKIGVFAKEKVYNIIRNIASMFLQLPVGPIRVNASEILFEDRILKGGTKLKKRYI